MCTVSTSSKSGPSDRYHHGDLRRALVDEALVLLAESGDGGFSLRELARRVGVTANASYRHFA
ncbi:MAG TPA: TetR/AcrR family transcriptional regulator, partial [Alcanivorax sp.]|nr:TetR/AcrR family transcriptional regulator [Alcanivorax sp.]